MWWVRFENWLRRPFLPGRTRGAAFTEYAVLLALIAVVVIAAVTAFGDRLATMFTNVTNQLPTG
jgi:pilus assembly protein Flp/PilA